ncbi:MAG: adenylate/guanylate cyclase domain-containing protein, partial [Bacteroidota bacterium]
FHHPETLDTMEEWLQLATSASRILHPEFARLQQEHTLHSGLLHGGEETELPLSLSESSYRLISLTHHRSARLDIEEGAEPLHEIRGEFGERGVVLSQAIAHPGNLQLRLCNHGAEAVLFTVIKRPPMTLDCLPSELRTRFRPFLDGKRLLTTQAFRELFRAETIAPGGSFSLRTLTILFTDLKGSTALYERVGDLAAYRLVREHFKILEEAVAAGGGAIVKTIGDAIMATFPHPRQAVGTISRMHHRLDEWNRANGDEDLTLKVGLHEGPCIAVNSNDKVDFFGQTVNLAARIQGLAGSRETYLSESVLAREGVQETLGREGFELHPETAHLKGISEEVRVVRATLPLA